MPIATRSIIKVNMNHQKVQSILKLKLQHIPPKGAKQEDNVIN